MESPTASVLAARRHLARALRTGAIEQAAAILERLRREDPTSVQTRGGELELLLKSGRLEEASRLAVQLVELYPTSARIHYLAGRVAYRRRHYAQALGHLEESQRISSHWRTRHWVGKTMTQLGRLAEAEGVLVALVADHPHVDRDISWLYQRMDDRERAVEALERYLRRYPDDSFAARELQRLRAQSLAPDRLVEEVETLIELGEPLPPAMLTEFVEGLLRTGQGRRARELIAAHGDELDDLAATRLGWSCHRLQASDLASHLFLRTVDRNAHSPKFRVALERAVLRSGGVEQAVAVLREHAGQHRVLWGLIRRLERHESTD